jgi:hypothetical protein
VLAFQEIDHYLRNFFLVVCILYPLGHDVIVEAVCNWYMAKV